MASNRKKLERYYDDLREELKKISSHRHGAYLHETNLILEILICAGQDYHKSHLIRESEEDKQEHALTANTYLGSGTFHFDCKLLGLIPGSTEELLRNTPPPLK